MPELPSSRLLTIGGVANVRDLGGLPRADGTATAPGSLVRSGHLQGITPAGRDALRHLGIGLVVDLRERWLVEREPSPFAGDPTVAYAHVALVPEDFPLPVPVDRYHDILRVGSDGIRRVFELLAADPRPALVHCHSGTGRTGLVAMLLLALADVPPNRIDHDYRLSFAPGSAEAARASPVPLVLAELAGTHGGTRAYLRGLGLADTQIAAVRHRLVPA
jgi:protein-tyrosine phosphatase